MGGAAGASGPRRGRHVLGTIVAVDLRNGPRTPIAGWDAADDVTSKIRRGIILKFCEP